MACTMATLVPCDELEKYQAYLREMGFKQFDLFTGKNGETTLYLLFTDNTESKHYIKSKAELRYLVVGE